MNKSDLLMKRFAAAAAAHHEALEAMDEGRANAQARMLSALHRALMLEGEPGRERLVSLLENSVPAVAGMAAVFLLHLCPGRCLPVLRNLASQPGLLGFRAGVAVERWESGDWTPPA